MKIFEDNDLKLAALSYAENKKIVSQKTIQAFQDAVRQAEKVFTPEFIIKYIADNWDLTNEKIEEKANMVYYGGGGEQIHRAYQSERLKYTKQRELAKACKEYLLK